MNNFDRIIVSCLASSYANAETKDSSASNNCTHVVFLIFNFFSTELKTCSALFNKIRLQFAKNAQHSTTITLMGHITYVGMSAQSLIKKSLLKEWGAYVTALQPIQI